MDEFEKRLKDDAAAIEAKVSPELAQRIETSLRATRPVAPVAPRERQSMGGLWWASSLTGLATALVAIVLINWNRGAETQVPGETIAHRTEPQYVEELQQRFPLDARTAEFEAPLEEELLRLKADLEKARQTVRKDIEFAF